VMDSVLTGRGKRRRKRSAECGRRRYGLHRPAETGMRIMRRRLAN